MSRFTCFDREISQQFPALTLLSDEPMAKHTSFRIGGNARRMAFPENEAALSALLSLAKKLEIPCVILGAGTNVLAPDGGLEKLVICLKDALNTMEQVGPTTVGVAAGVTMSRAAVFAASRNLGGLEFAHGIPGTIGGGVYMNAGAYGGEMKDVCRRVRIMEPDGTCRWLEGDALGFSYRHSAMEEHPWIVVAAELELTPRPEAQVKEKMRELIAKRRASQPLELPSAGSAFKRPVGGYAAALIDQAGLKGYQVGGAAISTKHAGFAVNLGDATAEDVKTLLRQVSERVYAQSGIRLEPEIRIW